MISHPRWLPLVALSATIAQTTLVQAQPTLSQAGPVQQVSPAEAARAPQPLGAERLDTLLAPFAGAPQDVLGVVLDACRYPAELLEAVQWTRRPEATRGSVKETWPSTVRLLAERAPRTLEFLTQDMATTAALGSAYQYQPNDVWMAYGRVTERQMQQQPAAAQSTSAAPVASPLATATEGSAPTPDHQAAGPPKQPAGATPAQMPDAAPAYTAPAATAGVPAAAPTQVVVTPAPANSGTSAAGAALVGGLVGLGAGLLISELADNNNDYRGPAYGYRPPYSVPPPYAPYGGGHAGPARYDAARSLQEDRQTNARQMQASQQTYASGRREDWQGFATGQQQQREAATGQRQATRQQATQTNQAARQSATQARQALVPPPAAGSAAGAERRETATAGQARAQVPAAAQRPAAPQQVAARTPQRAATQSAGRPPEWGPARGMSGGTEVARSRGAGAAGGGRAGAAGGRVGRR